MFTITKQKALEIQARQLEHYASVYGAAKMQPVVAEIHNRTTADALPDGEIDVILVNHHIPRGGSIEAVMVRLGVKRDDGRHYDTVLPTVHPRV